MANVFAAFAQPVKSVQQYNDDRDAREVNRLALQEKRRTNALAEAATAQQAADRTALQRAAQASGGDQNKLIAALRGSGSAGLMGQADAIEKALLERRNTESQISERTAKTGTEQARAAVDRLSLIGQLAGGVRDQATYEAALGFLGASGIDVAKLGAPAQYDPAVVERFRTQALTEKDRVEQQFKQLQQAEVARSNKEREVNTVRGQDLTARTTMRGQNLTDARGREANQTQRELLIQEKGLKIADLQDKADARTRAKDAGAASIQNQIAVIDKALMHPGRQTATGLSGSIDPRNYVPGTDATDFRAVLDQIGGSAFLQAFESLKGGGAITEVEGKKATDAIARLNRAQSDAEFETSLNDLRKVMVDGYERLGRGKAPSAPSKAPSGAAFSDPAKQKRYEEWKAKQR
jgi:hypothetical protein